MEFPFKDAPNTACIACNHVLNGERPILYISHDEEDGMWQFLCGEGHVDNDAKVISLYSAFMIDQSIGEMFDLPCGCCAERKSKIGKWEVE